MATFTYQKSAAEVVATLIELFEHQGNNDLAEILRASQSRIEHVGSDDWNNSGTEYLKKLRPELPPPPPASENDDVPF